MASVTSLLKSLMNKEGAGAVAAMAAAVGAVDGGYNNTKKYQQIDSKIKVREL